LAIWRTWVWIPAELGSCAGTSLIQICKCQFGPPDGTVHRNWQSAGGTYLCHLSLTSDVKDLRKICHIKSRGRSPQAFWTNIHPLTLAEVGCTGPERCQITYKLQYCAFCSSTSEWKKHVLYTTKMIVKCFCYKII